MSAFTEVQQATSVSLAGTFGKNYYCQYVGFNLSGSAGC